MPKFHKVSRLAHIPGIGVDKMGALADHAKDPDILRLENLDTDLPPPPEAIEVTRQAIGEDMHNSYLPFVGQDALRKAAAKRVNQVAEREYDWQSECIITAGGMSGILNCFLALVEPGDEVIVTDPTYAGIINRIHLAGATPVFVPLLPTDRGWRLDQEALSRAVSPKTRLICISPGMPTGHIFTREEWEAVGKAAVKADCYLLYDAAMEKILYDKRQVIHPATLPALADRTITVGAASKELRMIGWRVGWVVGPKEVIDPIGLVSISNVVCQTGISMAGVACGLQLIDSGLTQALETWEKRRNILIDQLAGLPVTLPHGGWSVLVDASKLGISGEALSNKMFTECKIAATPMSGWGPSGDKYLRLVFSNEPVSRLKMVRHRVKKIFSLS